MSLSEAERQRIKELLGDIQNMGDKIVEPIDPKVEGCLELAFNMLVEQLECDRRYEWEGVPPRDDKFLYLSNDKDNEIPGVDELNNWLPKDDDGG